MNWFLTTPIDGEHVDILVSAKVRALARFESEAPSFVTRCLGLVPGGLRQRLLHPLVMYEFKKNIEKDFMWCGTTRSTPSDRYSIGRTARS